MGSLSIKLNGEIQFIMKATVKYRIKWWFVVVSAFYYFSIMFSKARMFTYMYFYGIPFIAFLFNINWCIRKLRKLFSHELMIFTMCYFIIFIASIAIPIIHATYDFSYFLDGPITAIIKLSAAGMFLLLLYEKRVSKEPNVLEFLEYYIYSVLLYVFFTSILCVFPRLRAWISQTVYYTPITKGFILIPEYFTRIGWSGFSGFDHTLHCTLAIVCAYIFIFNAGNNKREFWKWHICIVFLVVGNMFYGRSGLAISLLCIILGSLILYLSKNKRVILYLPAGIGLATVILMLKNFNTRLKIWYDWCFNFIISFFTTGKINSGSWDSMIDMYFMPKLETILLGDGRYADGEHYYMRTDIGFIRPILFYGVFFTCLGYIACCRLIIIFRRRLPFLSYKKRQGIMFMLFLVIIIFELKGEVFHVLIAFLLPLCLMDVKYRDCCFS